MLASFRFCKEKAYATLVYLRADSNLWLCYRRLQMHITLYYIRVTGIQHNLGNQSK